MRDLRFGISSRLFRDVRLCRDHLVHIAAHEFESIELYASPAHFDYRDAQALADLAEWLSDTGLSLHAVHAPADEPIDGIDAVLEIARAVPFEFLVLHRTAANERHIERLAERASASDVQLALELLNDPRADATTLVHVIEDELEDVDVGICLDFGHAHLRGDLDEAIELVSGHVVTTHLHDNRGKHDEHLVPYAGSIRWESAVMETQKIGYDGVLMFEPAADGDAVEVLKRCVSARRRMEKAFLTF
jgi:sugar phosphate isomerase/epimerase